MRKTSILTFRGRYKYIMSHKFKSIMLCRYKSMMLCEYKSIAWSGLLVFIITIFISTVYDYQHPELSLAALSAHLHPQKLFFHLFSMV